jgi:hypothetical protein
MYPAEEVTSREIERLLANSGHVGERHVVTRDEDLFRYKRERSSAEHVGPI